MFSSTYVIPLYTLFFIVITVQIIVSRSDTNIFFLVTQKHNQFLKKTLRKNWVIVPFKIQLIDNMDFVYLPIYLKISKVKNNLRNA